MNKFNNIAIVGSTGGLGQEISQKLAKCGYNLIFVDRNYFKASERAEELKRKYNVNIDIVNCDLENMDSVRKATADLSKKNFDTIILNAGIYNVPIKNMGTGYNNIFQVNFISQYYIARKLVELNKIKKVVAMGSIAYKYGKFNLSDVDYSSKNKQSKIYGNSKRVLMCALYELQAKKNFELSIVHPGVTLTKMTNHYPKYINWLVKFGIKTLFPSPKKAISSAIMGVENSCGYLEWIGPKIFNVWGKPKKNNIKISATESQDIGKCADEIYSKL